MNERHFETEAIRTQAERSTHREHSVPLVVCAPWSTIDARTANGDAIPIELRDADEIRRVGGTEVAAAGAGAWNPAFDVTPAKLIGAIVTDRGLHRPPYSFSI